MSAMFSGHPEQPTVPFLDASVADAMSHGVIYCTSDTPLRVVARMMAIYRVHAIYVFDDREDAVERWGLVSDLDIAAAARSDVDRRTAADSSVTPLVNVTGDQPLAEAAELMAFEGMSHLAVLDPLTRRPIGVVSTLDIARAIAAG